MSDDHVLSRPWSERIGVPESFTGREAPVDQELLPGGAHWGPLLEEARRWLDALTEAAPPQGLGVEMRTTLARWASELTEHRVAEIDQPWGHRVDLAARGQALAPHFELTRREPDRLTGTVTFGRFHLGGHGAVHGGAVALFFDEVLGRFSDTGGRPAARTVSLDVSFRSITPVGRRLDVHVWFDSERGRKRTLRGEIRDGDVLCAEATGLFIALLAHQV
ncbi:hotdog domain-containing protein [Nocardioides daejeonensis]|uniref:hotdog domain-containing protein n=1 Tax=Nocardioides daejeonensis TaxID=1046556 RepID=UPI000D744392|nr:hotdog domain-containing protein [Nocardioides daejeonensis]